MGVDWGEYFGTEDPDEMLDLLDQECWEAAHEDDWQYPTKRVKTDKERNWESLLASLGLK